MRVIVGVNGSESAMSALVAAAERARAADDDLTVAVYGGPNPVDVVETRVRDRLSTLGIDAPVERLEGHPGGLLVERAEQEGFDRIILPGGTRSPLGKIQFDSTVEFVLLNAQTAVTLIR
jgi:nucleotide-binding universal stress UspA family protein